MIERGAGRRPSPALCPKLRSQLAECAEGLGDDLILMRVTGCMPATVVIHVLGDRLRAGPWFGHTGRQAACRPGLQSDAVSRRSALSPQQAGVARPSGPSVFGGLIPSATDLYACQLDGQVR